MNHQMDKTNPEIFGEDYIVELKVRNGPLLRAMRRAGFYTASSLATAAGLYPSAVGMYLNLKAPALHARTGDWRDGVIKISKCLRCLPEDLFPTQHYEHPLAKNIAEYEMSLDDVMALPDSAASLIEHRTPETGILEAEDAEAINAVLETLRPREREIIERRFGFGGRDTELYREIADDWGVSVERVRQIHAKALRKLKQPQRANALREQWHPKKSGDHE
jgi:RNA polymerase sigma factor (sigma-70 family)